MFRTKHLLTTFGIFVLALMPLAYLRATQAAPNLDPRASLASELVFHLAQIAVIGLVGGFAAGAVGAGALLGLAYGVPLYNDLVASGAAPETARSAALLSGALHGGAGFIGWSVARSVAEWVASRRGKSG